MKSKSGASKAFPVARELHPGAVEVPPKQKVFILKLERLSMTDL
jgi:hypothetical protein